MKEYNLARYLESLQTKKHLQTSEVHRCKRKGKVTDTLNVWMFLRLEWICLIHVFFWSAIEISHYLSLGFDGETPREVTWDASNTRSDGPGKLCSRFVFFFLTAFRWNGELFDVFFSDIAAGIRGGGFLSWLFLFTLRQAEMLEMMKDLSIWQIRLDGLKPPPRIACVVLHEVVEEMCSFIAGAEESTTSNPAWKNWRMTIKVASISWIYPPPRIPVAN